MDTLEYLEHVIKLVTEDHPDGFRGDFGMVVAHDRQPGNIVLTIDVPLHGQADIMFVPGSMNNLSYSIYDRPRTYITRATGVMWLTPHDNRDDVVDLATMGRVLGIASCILGAEVAAEAAIKKAMSFKERAP